MSHAKSHSTPQYSPSIPNASAQYLHQQAPISHMERGGIMTNNRRDARDIQQSRADHHLIFSFSRDR
eukprot:1156674-Pelagomonas_calceolata.AAC.22